MTIPSFRSLIFEVKSTWSELRFLHVLRLLKTSDVFRRLRTSSEDFGILRGSSEMIMSSSKIPALPGYKSRAYISEKVGRYMTFQRMYRSICRSLLDRPTHRLALCREFIPVEHPSMSANILTVILLVVYGQKHISQLTVNYWLYTGQLLVLYQLIVEK